MATQKTKFTEADKKALNEYYEKIKGTLPEEHFEKEYEYMDTPYGRRSIGRPMQRGLIMSDKINHCKSGGGTMSECAACNLKTDSEKHQSQQACHYYKKNTNAEKCRFETFGEYCWSVDAQKAAKKG